MALAWRAMKNENMKWKCSLEMKSNIQLNESRKKENIYRSRREEMKKHVKSETWNKYHQCVIEEKWKWRKYQMKAMKMWRKKISVKEENERENLKLPKAASAVMKTNASASAWQLPASAESQRSFGGLHRRSQLAAALHRSAPAIAVSGGGLAAKAAWNNSWLARQWKRIWRRLERQL